MRTLVLVALVAMVVGAAMGENLLQTPRFDKGQATWKVVGGQGRYSVKDGVLLYRKDGEASRSGSRENVHVDQIVAVDPGTAYVVGARFRAQKDLRPVLRVAGMDWATKALLIAPPANGQWQAVRTVLRTGNDTELRVQIFGGALTEKYETAIGTSLCDGVFLRRAGQAELAELRSCRITVDTERVIGSVNPLFFGVNALFWIEDDAARADGKIGKYLKEMPCRLMRYPGGEVADNFHWRTNLLDSNRDFPKEEGPDELEFDEFMAWLAEIGAEPILVVNLESGFLRGDVEAGVREAAEWVRYANVEKGYGVRYWEIGNESDLKGTRYPLTSREYADALVRFSKAMKAVDPSIKIGALGPRDTQHSTYLDQLSPDELAAFRNLPKGKRKGPISDLLNGRALREVSWWDTVTEIAKGHFDFAIIHQYSSPHTYEAFVQNPITEGEAVATLHRYFEKRLGQRIPIALTEWNTNKGSKARGIGKAMMLSEKIIGYLEGGVDMACFWPLRFGGTEWSPRAMLEMETNERRPEYDVMQLYASNVGARLVAHESSNSHVRVLASREDERMALFLVNKSPEPEGINASIALNARSARAVSLVGESEAAATFDRQNLAIKRGGKVWECLLPRHSVTLVEFRE